MTVEENVDRKQKLVQETKIRKHPCAKKENNNLLNVDTENTYVCEH